MLRSCHVDAVVEHDPLGAPVAVSLVEAAQTPTGPRQMISLSLHTRTLSDTLRTPNRLESTMLRRISPSGDEVMDVRKRFLIAQDGRPSDAALEAQATIREKTADLAEYINSAVEPSRELSLALTHLEEALMWAGKGLFR